MKTFIGKVISDKMTKAAVVLIERKYRHPLYGKILSKKKKIHAQNELGAKIGQEVKIRECRPISKTISFKIVEILSPKSHSEEKKKEESTKVKED